MFFEEILIDTIGLNLSGSDTKIIINDMRIVAIFYNAVTLSLLSGSENPPGATVN